MIQVTESGPKVLELGELSKGLKVHVQTLRRLIHSGRLRAAKIGRRYLVTETALNELFGGPKAAA